MQEWCAIDRGFRPYLSRDLARLEAAGFPARLVDVVDPAAEDGNPFTATELQARPDDESRACGLLDIPRGGPEPGTSIPWWGNAVVTLLWCGLAIYFLVGAYFSFGLVRGVLFLLGVLVTWVLVLLIRRAGEQAR